MLAPTSTPTKGSHSTSVKAGELEILLCLLRKRSFRFRCDTCGYLCTLPLGLVFSVCLLPPKLTQVQDISNKSTKPAMGLCRVHDGL